MKLLNKNTNKVTSCLYSYWIYDIVKKGLVNEYSILEYPDIVKLVMIDVKGETINEKIIEKKTAESKLNESPNQFRIEKIDIALQIQKDIGKSNTSNKTKRRKFFYWLSYLLLFPLFSKKNRLATKEFIDRNINVITLMIGIISIIIMLIVGILQLIK